MQICTYSCSTMGHVNMRELCRLSLHVPQRNMKPTCALECLDCVCVFSFLQFANPHRFISCCSVKVNW